MKKRNGSEYEKATVGRFRVSSLTSCLSGREDDGIILGRIVVLLNKFKILTTCDGVSLRALHLRMS